MTQSPWGSIEQQRQNYTFWAMRGAAIEGYSSLEQSMCRLLALVSGMEDSAAATVFFKVTASRSRAEILDKLFKAKFGNAYRPFWNSMMAHFRHLDQRRNELVHWASVHEVGGGADRLYLSPPNFWTLSEDSPSWTQDELLDFMSRCDVVKRALNGFTFAHREGPRIPNELPPESNPLLQEPLEYPLPAGHRLARSDAAPIFPPPPW